MGAVGSNWPANMTLQIASLAYELRIAKANKDQDFVNEVYARALALGISIDDRGPNFIDLNYRGGGTSIVELIDGRNAARKAKNFKEADRIRDELKAMGIEVEDKPDGTTTWKVKR